MYVNPHFAERELPVLHDTIEAVRFGLLVLCHDGPLAAHVPFVLHREEGPFGTLFAHVARNDPLARHLDGDREALVIFTGPRAYVSPRWYSAAGLPTYNFLAVHAHGHPRPLESQDAVLNHLGELVDVHERPFPSPWTLAAASESHVAGLLPHVAAFTLEIEAIQGKRKLSQNRTVEDRDGVIRGLRERGRDDDRAIAEAMVAYPYAPDPREPM
ncbi:MAG TPA: FMN-binding negative transcriptional regulator [Solirubrobacteraceae bacterium]|jgi:transcriptional regulator